jgi:hypothetical protein
MAYPNNEAILGEGGDITEGASFLGLLRVLDL